MKEKGKRLFICAGGLLVSFVIFTAFVAFFDVKPVGPYGSSVGFATINQYVFQMIGVHLIWYSITDWLGVAVVFVALGFAAAGLYQFIKRKHIGLVDRRILLLGGFYILLILVYLLFEEVVINCRPVLLNGVLEASYPSSHTIMVVCIMATAVKQFRLFYPENKRLCLVADIIAVVLIALTVIGRLVSGVHWFTDIIGGVLLSAGLVTLFFAAVDFTEK